MAHSKRNTSLPHFTSYERGLLRSTWGTQRGVIGRDSFLPFGSCRLCLHPARAPVVACATNGDLFCRECAISDLLAQRQEIKRLERERADAKQRLAEDEEHTLEEARQRELREFELVSMGLDSSGGTRQNENHKKRKADESAEAALAAFKKREIVVDGKRKKVFELDEEEMRRVAREEQDRLTRELKREKLDSSKSALPSFWVPSLTPSTDPNEIAANKAVKLNPICPASTDTNQHSYSLKSLVEVHFTEEKASDGSPSRVCPSCKKTLTNGLKAFLTKPCGHVVCSPCVSKFMTPHDAPDPHATKEEQAQTAALHGRVLCYVCETDITPRDTSGEAADGNKKKKKKNKDREGIQPGLVEISCEGTGYAGAGGNVAVKKGVAFQC